MVVLAHQPVLVALATPVLAAGGDTSTWRAYFEFLGVFHPAVSHFPIALLAVAGLVEAWSIIRRHKKPSQATLVCLVIGTVSAVVATVLGWADADRMGYAKGETINLHRWLGVAVAVLSVLALILAALVHRANAGRKLVWSYRSSVLASAALVGFVGSLGGKLVHGKNYYEEAWAELAEKTKATVDVVEDAAEEGVEVAQDVRQGAAAAITGVAAAVVQPPAPATPTVPTTGRAAAEAVTAATTQPAGATAAAAAAAAPDASAATQPAAAAGTPVAAPALAGGLVDYKRDILPIFEAECFKCHSEDKKVKGEYRMDGFQHVMTAGETGNTPVIPGKSDDSYLVKLIEGKGEFEDLIMPPKGKPLTPQQILLIRRWIDEGAKESPAP